jgi:type I restriction enzyme R subunit
MANAFRDGGIPTSGTAITKLLPATSRFSESSDHAAVKQRALDRLQRYFDRFFGLL